MKMAREIKGVLVALLIAVLLFVGLFFLRSATTPEKKSVEVEVSEEGGGSAGAMVASPVGGLNAGAGGKLPKKGATVEQGQNVLDALKPGASNEHIKDHLKMIRESTR